MAATIRDIAQTLGVSRGTVDRALHDRGGIAPEVREEVLRKAEELGYKANRAGLLLASRKKPRRIGVFLPSEGNPFFDEVIRGMKAAEAEYRDLGFSLVLTSARGFFAQEHVARISELVSAGVDALVVTTMEDEDVLAALAAAAVPVIAVNSDISFPGRLCYVGPDYYEKGAIDAGLLSLASDRERHILILTGSGRMKGHSEVVTGFLETLEKRKAKYSLTAVCNGEDDDEVSFNAVREALSVHPETDTLFISTAGAAGAVRAAEGLGLLIFASDDVPQVKKLVLEGKIAWTVSQEPYVQGYQAIRKICEHLISPEAECSSLLTSHIVKLRENIGDV